MIEPSNIIQDIEKDPSGFIEEFGNIVLFCVKNDIHVFSLKKYKDNDSIGIILGINPQFDAVLQSEPDTFQELLNPANVEEINLNSSGISNIVNLYQHRNDIKIELKNTCMYKNSIYAVMVNENDIIENLLYREVAGVNGFELRFRILSEKYEKLNMLKFDDKSIYTFLRIFMLTWLKTQPDFNK